MFVATSDRKCVEAQTLRALRAVSPVIWLGCYGAAVVNGGQVSVAPVRYLGLCLLATAAGAAASPAGMGLTWLAVGFGWLHIIYGGYIAWRNNG